MKYKKLTLSLLPLVISLSYWVITSIKSSIDGANGWNLANRVMQARGNNTPDDVGPFYFLTRYLIEKWPIPLAGLVISIFIMYLINFAQKNKD